MVKKLYTYPSSYTVCGYTCTFPSTRNSKSNTNKDDNDNTNNGNINIEMNNNEEGNNKDIIDESLNVYGFETDMNEIILSSLEADKKSRRMRRK